MSVLICKPVSSRSRPERIQWWIGYLEELREKHQSDTTALATIDRCLRMARNWVSA